MHVMSRDLVDGARSVAAALRALVLVAGSIVGTAAAANQDSLRNVVLIVADDMGLQLGCYGDDVVKTPRLDRLAQSGVRFTRAYCTTASCSASRSVLLSGLYNHANGQYGLAHRDHHFSAYDTVRSLPVMLSEAGYRTANFGKHHVTPEYVFHFEETQPQNARNPVDMANRAKGWIAAHADRPFFLYFCPVDPHRGGRDSADGFANRPDEADPYPGVPRVLYDPAKIRVPSWLPDRTEVRSDLAQYYQSISRLDAGVGRLLDVLDETGHADDTLVIFLSDNGPPFPGAKTTLYEPGINLPLIVRDPTRPAGGTTCDAIVTWADITPTILEFCGVSVKPAPPLTPEENRGRAPEGRPAKPYPLHGRSFLAAMSSEHPEGWEETYYSHTFHEVTNYYPMRGVRSGRYKLILNLAHPLPFPFASDLYHSPTWQGVLARKNPEEKYGPRTVAAYLNRPKFELYDLEADPQESRNLANDPAHAETLKTLASKIRTWQQTTRDPWEHKWEYE
jgi:N-sulfoglucosamine sulfohydrolase